MARLLGGGLLCGQVRSSGSEVGPVDVWAQFFTADRTTGLSIEVDTQPLTKALTLADCLAQIAFRGFAARHQFETLSLGQAVEVGE